MVVVVVVDWEDARMVGYLKYLQNYVDIDLILKVAQFIFAKLR